MQESHLNHTNTMEGAMDLDSDLTIVNPADCTYALNIRNGYGSIIGKATNFKGNELISFPLPAGTNIGIGTCEDRRGESVLYFVYNSNGNHQILRYLSNQSPAFPSGRIERIAQGSVLNFNPDWLVHHALLVDGKLLYWTDAYTEKQNIEGNPPRKINIEKGVNDRTKKLSYYVYAGIDGQGQFANAIANGTQLVFQFYDKTTGAPTSATATIPSAILATLANDTDAILSYIDNVINILFPVFATSEYCECKTEITVREDLTLDIFETHVINPTAPSVLFVAGNHYPSPLEEHHIDLLKYPPTYEPTPTYQINTDITYNNVNQTTFQFRVRYIYDDGERSAWGPISILPLNTETDGTFLLALNEIKVDFTDPRLNDTSFLNMIEFVEVAFREGNLGNFKSIDTIPVCRIGINQQFIVFRNDKLYSLIESDDATPIGTAQALKLFDSVPILTGAIENVADRDGDSRTFLAANLENYDCPECVDLTFDVQSEPTDDCLISIKGKVTLWDWDYVNQLPATPSPLIPSTTFSFKGMNLGGFVVYLAGTDFFAISDSPQDGTGTGEFEIKNVPKGRYILRVASYMCAYDNRNGSTSNLNNGRAWQRTSSPVLDCAGSLAATTIRFERYIDLTAFPTNIFDLMTEPGYGDIKILNLQYGGGGLYNVPSVPKPFVTVDGYLYDNNGEIDADPLNNYTERKGAIGVELQRIKKSTTNPPPNLDATHTFVYPNDTGISDNMVTDQNGYFFFLSGFTVYVGPQNWSSNFIFVCADVCDTDPSLTRDIDTLSSYYGNIVGGTVGTYFGLQGLDNENLNTNIDLSLSNGLDTQILIYNQDEEFTENNKCLVNGTVVDLNGVPKENILICLEKNGRQEYTGINGNYSINVYCPWNTFTRVENIIATYLVDLCYDNEITPTPPVSLNIGPFCTDVNSTTPFYVPFDFEVNVSVGRIQSSRYLKRGASYNTGVVYEDRGNRKATVSKSVNSLYIPFFTEIGSYSKPITYWAINSLPPDWATHYRIVRTQNTVYRRYIHASIKTVRYVRIDTPQTTPADTTFANGDATHILISLSIAVGSDETNNPVDFFFLGDNGQGYEAEVFDRIRFISDETGTVFSTGIVENEIVGPYIELDTYYFVIKNPETFNEIKPDWLIEVYSPKRNEEVLYYEEGDTYPILNPHTPNRVHGGQIQNQIAGVQPATGILKGGDTYWHRSDYVVSNESFFTKILEHQYITSRFDSTVEDIGRGNLEDPTFKQQFYHNKIRMTGIYISGTSFNGLSSIRAIDVKSIDQRWGIIKKLILADKVMLAVAQFKIQPIYVAKDTLLDLSGNTNVGRSDQILNLADELKYDFGTHNPESVIEQDGNVYGWDVYQGVVWRYAINGLFPISGYKAASYFSNLGRDLYVRPRKLTRVFAGFEREFRAYVMTFGADGQVIQSPFTIAFDEVKNRWNTYISYTPSYYGRTGNRIVSLKDGQLWLHESENVPRNNFYGVQYKSQWRCVVNSGPKAVKLYYNIELQADKLWICPVISIPPNEDYQQGMLSRLKESRFSRTEGVWKADLLRDMNDTSAQFLNIPDIILRQATALLNGRNLRGEVMEITLETLDGSVLCSLRRLDTEFVLSMDTKG